jgi:hypothetical protein
MPVEVRTAGSIVSAFDLKKEFASVGIKGRVIYALPPTDHAYFLTEQGGVLNTWDQNFYRAENLCVEKLNELLETGQAIVIHERPQHRGPVDSIPLTRLL